MQNQIGRRTLLQLAGITAAESALGLRGAPAATSGTSLFDGKTLDGWIQIENSATSLPAGSITDPAAFAARLANAVRRRVHLSARPAAGLR